MECVSVSGKSALTWYASESFRGQVLSGHGLMGQTKALEFLSVTMGGNLIEVRSLDLNRSFKDIPTSLDYIVALWRRPAENCVI